VPNHITQVLTAEGADALERMRAYFTDFDQEDDLTKKREQWRGFDFGKIIERPPIVDTIIENGSDRYIPFLMNLDGAYVLWEQLRTAHWPQLKERPLERWQGFTSMRDGWMEGQLRHTFGDEPIDNAYRMIKCFAETGAKGWYDWSRIHWGTKWNAYSGDTDPTGTPNYARIKFQTAWDCPMPVLEKLATLEPALCFGYVAFDEGWNFYARGGGLGEFKLVRTRGPFTAADSDMIAAHVECYGEEPEFNSDEDDGEEP